MNDALLEEIRSLVTDAERILVTTHMRPDGDAIGSLLGLGLSLQVAGKEVQMVLDDVVPASLRHLVGGQQINHEAKSAFDLSIVVDCSDIKRIGICFEGISAPDLNIDHHPTNENYGKHNLVEVSASATTEMLAEFIPLWGLPVTKDVASALLTGLITDTLGFRTSSVTSKTMRIAADLIDQGAEMSDLYIRSMVQRSFEAARLWGSGLSQLEREGPIVWTRLSLQDRQEAGYHGRDDADLINVLSAIKDASIAIIFVEQPSGSVKVSWRAQPGLDVARLATQFGGGGHAAAAGAEVQGSMDDVMPHILKVTQGLLVN